MNNAVLSYIKNEKDIAKYNLKILGARDLSRPSIRRLIDIEKEFIRTPFETMDFKTVADIATAISIYRKSRNEFYQTYKVKRIQEQLNKDKLLYILREKIKNLEKISKDLWKKIETINSVQDKDIFEEIVEYETSRSKTSYSKNFEKMECMSLDELLELEPVKISKKRARIQLLFFSIFLYIKKIINEIPLVNKESSSLDIDRVIKVLDDKVDFINEGYMKFYNKSVDILEKILSKTMGRNEYICKMHKLINILDFEYFVSNPVYIEGNKIIFDNPKINNIIPNKNAITYSILKDKDKNIQNKVFGIPLPIERTGNEIMTLLYKEIYFENINISKIFCNSISNIKVEEDNITRYNKGILMLPIWETYQDKNSIAFLKIFSNILNIKEKELIDLGVLSENFKNKLNKATNFTINVSSSSKILVPKTRSEENAFKKIIPKINKIIKSIQKKYYIVGQEEFYAVS